MIGQQAVDDILSSPPSAASAAAARPRLLAWRVADTSAYIPPSLLAAVAAGTQGLATVVLGLAANALALAGTVDVLLVVSAGLLTAALLQATGLNRRQSLEASAATSAPRMLLALLAAITAAGLGVMALGLGPQATRDAAAIWIVLTAVGLFATRMGLSVLVRRWSNAGRLDRRAVIYGSGAACEQLIRALEADPACDVTIVGIADDRNRARHGGDVLGYPHLGTLADAIALARKSRVDTVLVSLPVSAEQRVLDILGRLSVLPAEICQPAAVEASNARIGRLPVRALLGKPICSWGQIVKSAFDRLVAGLALLMLSPVLAAVAIAVRLDSRGPVFFRQQRYGFNNELIEVLKFRSMYVEQCDASARRLVTRDDPRVTPVGRFIRKTSLDELPQLLNVLKGDLSLVGPRPHAVNAKANDRLYGEVVGSYFARHKVKPGITGWAQINGWRGETDTEEKIVRRVEHDLHYIENWSLLLDLEILLRTPLALLKSDNAY